MIDIEVLKGRTNNNINGDVIETIKNELKNDFDLIKEMSLKEQTDINLEEALNCFKDINNLKSETYKNGEFRITNNYIPYGVVTLSINNKLNIYQVIEIINLLLISHNTIVFYNKYMNYTLKLIIDCINKILKDIEDTNVINVVNESIDNLESDLLLYIGSKRQFDRIDNNIPKKYYGIGNYELYVDEVIDKNLIDKCKEKNVRITYRESSVNSFIRRINENTDGYCVSIMSNNNESIDSIINGIKPSYILINIVPFIEDRINIEITDLIKKRSIITYIR